MPSAVATKPPTDTTLSLVAALDAAYRDLAAYTEELQQVLAEPKPNRARLTSVRLKMAQLRLVHGAVIARIATLLTARATTAQAHQLQELRSSHENVLRTVSAHIGKWTFDTIEANWSDYRQETGDLLRRGMLKMQMDRQILYPLLRARP